MDNEYLKIIRHFGINKQLRKFNEENWELKEAIKEYEDSKNNPIDIILNVVNSITNQKDKYLEHIKEEIVDNLVMLEQFIAYYGIDKYEIEKMKDFKRERTMKIVKKEEENNNERITEDNVRKEN